MTPSDVAVLGGGPGGLYFAILLKRDNPRTRVRVIERNARGTTFGFGVAFHELTLRNLAAADEVSQQHLLGLLRPWDDVFFHVRDVEYRVGGHGMAGCARGALLAMLQERAADVGVEMEFGLEAGLDEFPEADLVVVADGSGSKTRARFAADFGAVVDERPNHFIWLGTTRPMDAMNFFFREQPEGIFVAHAYPHTVEMGTWIVETDDDTFRRAGLEGADEETTCRLVERVFGAELEGHSVVGNGSFWRRFPLVQCARWSRGNAVLLGDVKGTAHFSIGSGTKLAVEDAVALHAAITAEDSVPDAISLYEAVRRPALEELQAMAFGSMLWFEQLASHWPMDPHQLIFSGVTRKTNETYHGLLPRVPALAAGAFAAIDGAPHAATRPARLPFRNAGLDLSGRIVAVIEQGPPEWIGSGEHHPSLVLSHDIEILKRVVVTETPAGLILDPRDVDAAFSFAGRATEAGASILFVDLSEMDPGNGRDIASALTAATARWAADRPVGARLPAATQIAGVAGMLEALVRVGCALIDVSTAGRGGGLLDHQVLLSDLIRHQFGIATICGGLATDDEADTVLVAGRADLVLARNVVDTVHP